MRLNPLTLVVIALSKFKTNHSNYTRKIGSAFQAKMIHKSIAPRNMRLNNKNKKTTVKCSFKVLPILFFKVVL